MEYAEFSMAQGVSLRDQQHSKSQHRTVSPFNINPNSSLEEKLMLFQLFDRHDRSSGNITNQENNYNMSPITSQNQNAVQG